MLIGKSKGSRYAALVLTAPFVLVYALLFVYPTVQMFIMSMTNAPLIGSGAWVGFDNFISLFSDRLFIKSAINTFYFVALTVIPTTFIGLIIALLIHRLRGSLQSLVLASFFLPYILPVSVVTQIWQWVLDPQFGVAQSLIEPTLGRKVAVFAEIGWAMPAIALITIWWTSGFNILLFLAGLRSISKDYYEAADLDAASPFRQLTHITLPLLRPVIALVLTIQLILQLKIFDQVYLITRGGPANTTLVLVEYVYKEAFQLNKGGYAAAVSVVLFLVIVVFSSLQFLLLGKKASTP